MKTNNRTKKLRASSVDKFYIQMQCPGGSFRRPSITLTHGGDTVLIPISLKTMCQIRETFKHRVIEEG